MELPLYLKQPIPDAGLLERRGRLFANYSINTVCKSARCPNSVKCLKDNTVTFMILGKVCSRACLFCSVYKGRPEQIDVDEPYNVACVIKAMGLDYAVITSVCRDDLSDSGAGQFAAVCDYIRLLNPDTRIELLIPDFCGSIDALKRVIDVRPDCIGHNLEMVPRLYPELNRISSYERSLGIIGVIKKIDSRICLKSGIMLGLGEEKDEVIGVLEDLKNVDCDVVTIGQYLSPSKEHFPVKRFLEIEEFEEYGQIGLDLGFKKVFSGPLVRSSYRAREVYRSFLRFREVS